MTNFPSDFDDDTTLPAVNDNITEIGGEAINALRDAIFAIEQELGLGGAGSAGSVADRIGISLFADGSIKPSAIASMGLVTLPIFDNQISVNAQILESKLRLDHRTQDLYNYILDLSKDVNKSLGWISTTGIKIEPHLLGAIFRHTLDQIDISSNTSDYLRNKFGLLRDNTNAYTLTKDINTELLFHQFADGSPVVGSGYVVTNDGSTYPSNFAHTASGVWLNTSRFAFIPQTAQDLQTFAEFVDNSSILLYGTRIQNLYSNGISRVSRSSSLTIDGYGYQVIGNTPAIAYLLNIGNGSAPFDDIDKGDDIIEFVPPADELSSNSFDEKFALVRVGDIIRVNYGGVEVAHIVREKKYRQGGGIKKFLIRIDGKNLIYAPNATARIDRSLVNKNKQGVLAIAGANNSFAQTPSLIVGHPRGAQALGLGFNAAQFDNAHYNLYLAIYPTGNPLDGYTILPAIDVTGNQGSTPGKYTLDSILTSTNDAFRQVGFNYRFIAFSHQGEFGLMLADPYNNTAFSILNGVVDSNGFFDQAATQLEFINNVVDVFAATGLTPVDPIGLGAAGSAIASPPFLTSYDSAEAAIIPTKLFVPLKRNNYYVNGVEKENLNIEIDQILDGYGDGYWFGTIHARTAYPGAPPSGRVETTYRILLDLSSSGLKIGKTLVAQTLGQGTITDFGRFTIKDVTFSICAPDIYTDITVYDSVHATGISPVDNLDVGAQVAIYFNDDSISFNKESSTDFSGFSPFKRHFEIYVKDNGETFTQERGRINISGSTMNLPINGNTIPLYGDAEIIKLNIIKISPKLRGYQFGSLNKITLQILSYDESLGIFDGYLASYDSVLGFTHKGPLVVGNKGQITRFYDETCNDYIDFVFDLNTTVASFTNHKVDIQLFPTLELDDEIMMLATCQLNDLTNSVSQIRDERQFGNTSEKDLTTSALNFISAPERLLHSNGIIRGFDLAETTINPNTSQIYLKGGNCLVNGKFIQVNDETIIIPPVKEIIGSTLYDINWAVCINDKGEYQLIPLIDIDTDITVTVLNPFRVFKAYNVVNGQSYSIESTSFSGIISSRKDLTPIYLVRSIVTAGSPPTFDLHIRDARKYVNDADSNLPLRLTPLNTQGNFHSVQSILTWLKFNGQYNGVAYVKGANNTNGIINETVTLNFSSDIIFDGEGNATLTFNGNVVLGSHIKFRNLTINFNGGVTIVSGSSDINFENCTINYTSNLLAPASNFYAFNFQECHNIKFADTIIIATFTQPLTSSALFKVENTVNFNADDCGIAVNFNSSPGVFRPANVFNVINSFNFVITKVIAFGDFDQFINNSSSSNMQLKDGIVQSSYNPTLDGIYDTRDVVNSGSGYFYADVTGNLDGIVIENMNFNYAPSTVTENRFSFINIELSRVTSSLTNSRINNCKFNDNNLGTDTSGYDGHKAAIAIININEPVAEPTLHPFLVNVNITNNTCNKNQAIVISSQTIANSQQPAGINIADNFDGYSYCIITNSPFTNIASVPGLACIGVNISNNVCGTIGYWITGGHKTINMPNNPSTVTAVDKSSSLNISGNNCHYIANLTSRGQYFAPSRYVVSRTIGTPISTTLFLNSRYNMTSVIYESSGFVNISNNSANWIHVGIASELDSTLNIVDNNLVAYDPAYLGPVWNINGDSNQPGPALSRYNYGGYADQFIINGIYVPMYNTAIRVLSSGYSATSPFGLDGCVNIHRNSTSVGLFYQNNNAIALYYYDSNYIHCNPSNNISHNFLRGFNGSDGYFGIIVGGMNNFVNNNKIFRGITPITAYVTYSNLDIVAMNNILPTQVRGTIVDNYFDSPYINNTGTGADILENVISLNISGVKRWIVERNINQTVRLSIPMANAQFATITGGMSNTTQFVSNLSAGKLGMYPTGSSSPTSTYNYIQHKSNILRYVNTGTFQDRIGWQDNICKYIPAGGRVIQVKMGVKSFNDGYFASSSHVTLVLNKYASATDYLDLDSLATAFSFDNSGFGVTNTTDIATNFVPAPTGTQTYARVTGSTISNGTEDTAYLIINTENINGSGNDVSNDFISNSQGYYNAPGFGITVDTFLQENSGSFYTLLFSPIMVKYRW